MKPKDSTWPQYLRQGIGGRLSHLGVRLNWHWLTYNPLVFVGFHEAALRDAPGVMRTLARIFPEAQRYLDVGAGSGAFAAEAQRLGKTVVACEHSAKGRRLASRMGVDCRPFDLAQTPPAHVDGPFDLVYCLEVAEHLPESLGERLVEFIALKGSIVFFTAAHPGQTGLAHINEQQKEYWIERFARVGKRFDRDLTQRVSDGFVQERVPAHYLIENAMVFSDNRAAKENRK